LHQKIKEDYMPRTKLDKYSITTAEKDTRIIRAAMARVGVFTTKSLAERLGTDPGYISKCFKKGFSSKMKLRIIESLRMNEEERTALMGW
jgi:AraC-like DNA-binding protein